MEQGINVIHLEVGRPNFDTPLHIKEVNKRALDEGLVHYGECGEGHQRICFVAEPYERLEIPMDKLADFFALKCKNLN